MKNNKLHIFEYLQKINDSPHDQALITKWNEHLKGCAMCRENLVLFRQLQNTPQIRRSKPNDLRFSNSQVISSIQKQIREQQFLPRLLRPLNGLAWIAMIVLMVVLLSWGILKLRAGQNNFLATSIRLSQPTTTPTQILPGAQNCRNIVYTVEENNTLLAISDFFNVSVTDVWEKNMLENDSALKPGMNLIIPFCGWIPVLHTYNLNGVMPINNCPVIRYTVQQGDTLEGISTSFNVPVAAIGFEYQFNKLILSPGDILLIPFCKNP